MEGHPLYSCNMPSFRHSIDIPAYLLRYLPAPARDVVHTTRGVDHVLFIDHEADMGWEG